jgi:hypothetical protein
MQSHTSAVDVRRPSTFALGMGGFLTRLKRREYYGPVAETILKNIGEA